MKVMLLWATGAVGTAIDIKCKEKKIECIPLSHEDIDIEDSKNLKKCMLRERGKQINRGG